MHLRSVSTRAEPLSFRAINDFGTPKKTIIKIALWIIVFLRCQLAKCPTAKSRPRLFRPTVLCEMVKSLFARKDRGTARVD